MGREAKLTNGIISAQTGYEGDVSNYQTSVPVSPGNSGGPLFDESGHLIGIIKAKHRHASNATYAIKMRNVLNLIDLLPKKINIPRNDNLIGKALQDQVKVLRPYVCFIKVYEH